MRTKQKKVDKFFLTTVLILVFVGVAMFISASLGVLAKNEKIFYSIIFNQLVLGLGLGFLGMYVVSRVDYKFWRKYSFFIFLGAILLTLAVFVPSLGFSHGGAQRWLSLGPISLQPAELLKFGFVIYFAAWLNWIKNKEHSFRRNILPFLLMITIIGGILLKQPDTKSLILIICTGVAMLFISGVPLKSLFGSALIIGAVLSLSIIFFPRLSHVKDRLTTYINPTEDQLGDAYQIKQSLIALGSGGILGRGYGQSVQKFTYLPEAQGDSIFAVLGEELGFLGATFVVIMYLLFIFRGFRIANHAPDLFGRLLVFGIVILIGAQAFMHIASVIGVFPLTGVPLPFMSHGGTSLMIYLIAVGIVLQVSKLQTKSS